MRPGFWQELYTRSEAMTTPARIKGALNPAEQEMYRSYLSTVFNRFVQKKELHLGLKVFVNQEMNREAFTAIPEDPPRENESMEEWARRYFGNNRFGLILNDIHKYNNDLARQQARDIRELLDITGMPAGGIGFLCFIGNYGLTPFGVHKDSSGEEGILFHLGPASKKFYTWETDTYLRLAGGHTSYKNPEKILETAICHDLEAGDAMFIPSDVYHIADTPEYFMSMVMDFINPSVQRFQKELLAIVSGFSVKNEDQLITPVKNSGQAFEALQTEVNKDLQKALEIHLMRLKSTGGLYSPSQPELQPVNDNNALRIKDPYSIGCVQENDVMTFIYGRA